MYLYEDAKARAFEPFSLTRPVSELMVGAEIIRKRWERVCGSKATAFIGPGHLAHFEEQDAPRCAREDEVVPAGSLIVNSRFAPALGPSLPGSGSSKQLYTGVDGGDQPCAVTTSAAVRVSDLVDGTLPLRALSQAEGRSQIAGRWLGEVWELISILVDQLNEDIPVLASDVSDVTQPAATKLGDFAVTCEAGAHIEPFVVLDASAGPILIRSGATISSFSRIVGPCYIGRNAIVVGDAIRACAIGETCKVRGEISNSVMLGYSNKGHTGFVGHSYLGRWVNLGSGTTTSNLKNTYGNVQMWTPSGMRDTGCQFLGTVFGDHVKTGIGAMLTTGTVIGAGANVYGRGSVPKQVPPFAWGDGEPYSRYELDKFMDVAARMMSRRHVELSQGARKQLADAYLAGGNQSP
jgi:UDP-N-acetylglucosamine diphosphorylase / glucose-1-phosphate thymidylyltransferase / UDP-N-acetylgalactosamine diphosphorylase / glucosamine-1-phosphate N-acetyltransferase / galactosamine-1-phosphate N-acetyltransferase